LDRAFRSLLARLWGGRSMWFSADAIRSVEEYADELGYTLADRKSAELTIRPELTVTQARALVRAAELAELFMARLEAETGMACRCGNDADGLHPREAAACVLTSELWAAGALF
jgi:hypothetical protein